MMKDVLKNLRKDYLRILQEFGEAARRRKASAYLVGGVVRDLVLGRKNLDLDVVVEGDALGCARDFAKSSGAKLTIHQAFKTGVLQWPDGLRLDVATARQETYLYPGALPVVKSGTLKDDLFRRDFTINALAVSINPSTIGQLIEIDQGLDDLRQGRVRILHDQSFVDDPTRILRAVRFEQRLGFKIEPRTLKLLKAALNNDMANHVKPPRYFAEFKKMLCEEDPLRCLRRLKAINGLGFLGDIKIDWRGLNHIQRQRKDIQRLTQGLETFEAWVLYLLSVLRYAKPSVQETAQRFHLTKKVQTCLDQARGVAVFFKKLRQQEMRRSAVYQMLRAFYLEIVLYARSQTARALVHQRVDRYIKNDMVVGLKINGNDIKQLGVTDGQRIGGILHHVLCLKLDNGLLTKGQELQAARAWLSTGENKHGSDR